MQQLKAYPAFNTGYRDPDPDGRPGTLGSFGILNSGAEFVLGDSLSPWRDHEQAIPLVTGKAKSLPRRRSGGG